MNAQKSAKNYIRFAISWLQADLRIMNEAFAVAKLETDSDQIHLYHIIVSGRLKDCE